VNFALAALGDAGGAIGAALWAVEPLL
jgi:hypothetical protein